jgi:hypothetical protein
LFSTIRGARRAVIAGVWRAARGAKVADFAVVVVDKNRLIDDAQVRDVKEQAHDGRIERSTMAARFQQRFLAAL